MLQTNEILLPHEVAMHPLTSTVSRLDRSERVSRRCFIERFLLALGICPVGLNLLGSGVSAAAPSPSVSADVESKDVKYSGDGIMLQGYLSHPKGKGPFPGVIVVDKYLNLVEHGRDVSRRLASAGYAALTADLLSRLGGTSAFATPEAQRKALRSMKNEDELKDLDASYEFMNSNSVVKKDDIAILGFEEGGQRSFLYATANPKLKAAVIYYGTAPSDDKLAQIQCPVLELVGDKDARVAPTVPVAQEKMKQLGKIYESKIYPGVDHAFFDETGERYNEAAARESWVVVLDFLKRNLH